MGGAGPLAGAPPAAVLLQLTIYICWFYLLNINAALTKVSLINLIEQGGRQNRISASGSTSLRGAQKFFKKSRCNKNN